MTNIQWFCLGVCVGATPLLVVSFGLLRRVSLTYKLVQMWQGIAADWQKTAEIERETRLMAQQRADRVPLRFPRVEETKFT